MPDTNGPTQIVKAAIYARVSSDDQREKGTIGSQVTALREFVPRWDMEIVGEYLDDGISGTLPLDKRPEGHRLMEDAKTGLFSVVVFYKTDRLARNLRYLIDAVDYFGSVNVALKCASEPFETETPVGNMIVQMLGSFAQMERGMIAERTITGRNRVAAQGKWTGGPVPYGYRLDSEGMLIPNWTPREGYTFSEAEIAQKIFQWIGQDQGSAISTAKRLNNEGIPMWRKYQTRGKDEPDYKSTTTGTWIPATITRMIRSPIYKGTHVYKGDIEREVTPLVDQGTWDSAQTQLASNRNLSKRPTDRDYLLRGFITCGDCGAAYSGASKPNNSRGGMNFYYRCGSQISSRRAATGVSCDAKLVRADWIEDLVWDYIKTSVKNPGEVLEELRTAMESELADVPKIAEHRKELERILRQKENENDRMLDAYRHEVMDMETLKEHMKRSKAEIEPVQAEYMKLMGEESNRATTVESIATTEELLQTFRDGIDLPLDWEGRREMVEAFVSGIIVETTGTGRKKKSNISVTYTFAPVGDVEKPTSRDTQYYSTKNPLSITRTSAYPVRVSG